MRLGEKVANIRIAAGFEGGDLMDESGEVTIDQLDEEISTLHNDLDMFRQAIQNYLEHRGFCTFPCKRVDDMLDDLDKDVSQEEVDRLIAYEKGDAIRLNIAKLDGSTFCSANRGG